MLKAVNIWLMMFTTGINALSLDNLAGMSYGQEHG